MQLCCSPCEDSVVEPEAVLVGLLVGEMSFKPTQLIFLYLLMVAVCSLVRSMWNV